MRENYTLLQGICQKKLTDSGGFVVPNSSWFSNFTKKPAALCLLVLAVFFGSGAMTLLAQTTVTVGTGTTGSYNTPINRFYNNSASEQLYLGSEIGSAGIITSLAFNKTGGTNVEDIPNITIYMKSTTATTLTNSSSLTGYTQVYSGSFPNTASGWQSVTLTTPFIYASSAANLSVLVVRGYQAWIASAASPSYAYTATTDYKAGYYANDSSAWSSTFTQTNNRPNVQLALTALPAACTAPDAAASVALSGVSSTSVTGTITASATAPYGYLVVRSTAAALTAEPTVNVQYSAGTALGGGTIVSSGTAATFTDTGVSANTHYYYFVYAYNYDGTFVCLGPAYAATAASADTTTCSTFPAVIGVSNITSTTATLNWTSIVGAGGAAATYTVEVYTDAAYTASVGSYTTSNLNYNLTGLTNGTTYYYRIQGATAGTCSDTTYATGSFTAQSNYTPIDVTGYNFDVIANGVGLPSTTTNNDVDGGNYAYISLDYKPTATTAATTFGLPVNRVLTNPTNADLKFFLQDYSVNNTLKLVAQNTSGTLTLAQPLKLSNIYLAVTSGSNPSTISVQVNFADGTNELVSGIAVLDWFGTATAASPALISNIGRVSLTGTGVAASGASKIFQVTVPVSAANQTKNVTSLTITNTTANSSSTSLIPNIFAVAGQVVGSCPVMAAVTASPASNTSLNVSWTTSSVGDGAAPTYTLEVYTDAAFTTPVTGSPFTGLTATSQAVTGLTFGTTYYYRVKASNEDCVSAYVTGSATIEYCVPTSTYATSYYITAVTTTGGYTNLANTATGSGSFNNYSTMAVSKSAGTSFDYSITRNSSYATVGVWVDWNQDLDFDDAGEQIATYIGAYNIATVLTGSIAIPTGTALGNYRMRVRGTYYYNTTVVPCGTLLYGETEDYTITVTDQPANCTTPDAPAIALSAITASSITATVTATATAPTGYLLVRSTSATLTAQPVNGATYAVGSDFGGGKVAAFGTAVPAVTDFLAANSHYYYFVYAYNDGGLTCFGPMYSTVASADAYTCALATVVSGASNIGNYAANLNWTSVVGNGGSAATYTIEVYNDAAMASLQGTYTSATNSYALTGLALGTTYYYRVKAVTTGCFSDTWTSLASFATQSAYTPLDVTGYNADVIANGTGIAALSTTGAVDGAANAYIALNYQPASATTTTIGLPVNRILSTTGIAGMQFILPDYTGNNSLRLPAQDQAGTLTLTQPVKLSNLYFALTSGSGTSTISAVVTFQDGTTQAATTFSLLDWYGTATAAQPALISGIGRANRANATGSIETGASKVFYVTLPILEANQAKLVASVTFTKTSTGATEPVPNIFAVSGKVIDECPVLNSAFAFASATGASVTFGTLAGSSAATSYNYELFTDEAMTIPVTGSPFTTTTTSLAITGLSPLTTYYYSAEAVNSACTSAPVTGSFTTLCTTPDAPAAAPQTVCAGTTVAGLTATGVTGATIKWYSSNTATTALTATTVLANGLYFVSQTVGTCESTRTSVAVTVNTVEAPGTAPLTFCGSATAADLTATTIVGATVTWYATVGGTPIEATTALTAGNYYVTQTVDGCTSTAATVAVIINTIPDAPTATAQTFCSGATAAELTVTGTTDATFTWSATEDGEAIADTAVLATGTYYVTQTVGTCTSPAAPVVVTVNPTPIAPGADAQTFCAGSSLADVTLTGLVEGATLTWYSTAQGGQIDGNTILADGSYFVSQTLGDCTSAFTEVVITVNALPMAPAAAPQAFCTGATVAELTATGDTGATIIWSADVDGTQPLTNTTLLETGTYYVAQVVGTCTSGTISVEVTITETPDAPVAAAPEQVFEGGETVADLDVTFAEGTTVTWYVLDEDVYVEIPATTALENGVTYYVTQSNGSCVSAYTAITANVSAGTGSFDVRTLTVYPNPARETVTVTSTENITHLVVNNLLGQKVMEQNANGTTATLNVSSLQAGTYLLQVTAGSKSGTIKIVKQ